MRGGPRGWVRLRVPLLDGLLLRRRRDPRLERRDQRAPFSFVGNAWDRAPPSEGFDSKSADNALNLLNLLRTELGKTIIMVTHDPAAANRAQRIVHLDKGRVADADAVRLQPAAVA